MSEHAHHVIPVRTYLVIFAILMGLLVATVAGAFAPFPRWMHLPVAPGDRREAKAARSSSCISCTSGSATG